MKNRHMQHLLVIAFLIALVGLPARLEAQQASSTGSPSSSADQSTNGSSVQASSGGDPASPTAGSPSESATKKSLPGARPLPSLLGMTLKQASEAFGPPAQVFPVRGHKAWEDDVVFYYHDHSYLFWFRDRVWQVRVDRRFAGKAIGVKMGESRSTVTTVLGKPFHVGQHSEIFILPDRGFPVRARLFFTDDKLSDIYVYRGDF